jgi:hypothetical protein
MRHFAWSTVVNRSEYRRAFFQEGIDSLPMVFRLVRQSLEPSRHFKVRVKTRVHAFMV